MNVINKRNASKRNLFIVVQSALDKWNLHGTEKDGSTYRMFHLSELLDKWNLHGTEKDGSTYRTYSLSDFSENGEFTNNENRGEGAKEKAVSCSFQPFINGRYQLLVCRSLYSFSLFRSIVSFNCFKYSSFLFYPA